jgi:threonine synthase
MPEHWPAFSISDFDVDRTLPQVGRRLLAPFAAGDRLEPELPRIIDEAFNFSAPLVALSDDGAYSVLELFHGPTAAFKDFGARFLASCFERLRRRAARTVNVLVATSGDTGGAVAAAFHGRPGTQVTVLFPRGLVSPTQQQQLTCWGDNVRAYAIRGTFDDCQRLVKEAFADPEITSRIELSSANSINLGRLLPQAVYYAASSLAHWRAHGRALSYIIPSGNLGNAAAAVIARRIGLPIGRIMLAHNANATVSDFLAGGHWQPRASVATLASAMDVGNPSNMERLRWLHVELGELQAAVSAHTVVDTAIQQRIRTDYLRHGWVWCPHTACAAEVHERLSATADSPLHWCIVATAHAAKFPEIVEPLIGRRIEVPAALAALFARPSRFDELDATLASLREVLISSRSA